MPKGVYTRARRPIEERFWEKVDRSGECWTWTAGCAQYGYGRFMDSELQGVYAHRFSYELANGPITEGMFVCHHCDNPPCVRPDHLFLGTQSDNVHDMLAKGRQYCPPQCPQGHVYDSANTIIARRPSGGTHRVCRACRTLSRRRRRVARRSHFRVPNPTGFMGVNFHKAAKRYRASISIEHRHVHLGYFDAAEDAARAYDSAAFQRDGEFARLNFPGQAPW